jgi:hypothetical protein
LASLDEVIETIGGMPRAPYFGSSAARDVALSLRQKIGPALLPAVSPRVIRSYKAV